jgi:hypothetical protein
MSALNEQQLAELKAKFYNDALGRSAIAALQRLKAKGCDLMVIQGYLGRVVGYKSRNVGVIIHGRGAHKVARRLRGIKRQLEKLAKETADVRSIWGFGSRMAEAKCMHIPEELEEMARNLSRVRVRGFADWYPQREAIIDLLDHVRSHMGRYHYEDVSTLINAEIAWRALKRGEVPAELSHDVDSLKMIVQRWKREQRIKLARLKDSTAPLQNTIDVDAPSQLNSAFPPQTSL